MNTMSTPKTCLSGQCEKEKAVMNNWSQKTVEKYLGVRIENGINLIDTLEEDIKEKLTRAGSSGYPGVGANITEQKRLQGKLIRQKVERQKEIARATLIGQEKERNELGRELHDNINQILAATKMQLEVHLKSEKGRPDCIVKSHEYLNMAMNEIRSLSRHLVSPRFQENNLLEEISFVIGNLGLDNKTIVEANNFPEEQVPEEIKLTIFRIVQEQLNNIAKYAHANSITINLEANENGIDLIINDDGVGFDTTQKKNGIGLSNIQTRAELYSGSVKIISAPGKGCCLEVFLPSMKEEE